VRGFDGDLTLQAERSWFVRNELSAALGQIGQEFYIGVDTGEVSGPSAQFLIDGFFASVSKSLAFFICA